jgi:thioesterase domain-containing protein
MVPVRTEGEKAPLFFVTGAGDVIGIYGTLVSLLDPDRPFFGFPDPMYTSLSSEKLSVELLAELYLREVRSVQPQGPYLLGGYSLGGLVAYEMARRLKQDGEALLGLIILDTCPPVSATLRRFPVMWSYFELMQRVCEKLWMVCRSHVSLARDFRSIARLAATQGFEKLARANDEPTLFEYVRWALRNAMREEDTPEGGPDTAIDHESRLFMLRDPHILKLFRSGRVARRVFRAYRFPTYEGRLTLLYAKDGWLGQHPKDDAFGWSSIVMGEVDVYAVSGTHTSIFKQPDVAVLASTISDCLNGMTQVRGDMSGDSGTSRTTDGGS